jgi:cytochrome c heme-lyase
MLIYLYRCGGPRLASFSGLASSPTPRARFNTLLGYQPPFDRHDWVVDRCGKKIEYVIDFYGGKNEQQAGKALNFYLDVRPKLNTWEGVKTRIMRFAGF